jgi:hypothetical protein
VLGSAAAHQLRLHGDTPAIIRKAEKALSTVASLLEERLAVGVCLGIVLNTS